MGGNLSFLSRLSQRLGDLKRDPALTAEHPAPPIRFDIAPRAGLATRFLVPEGGTDSERVPVTAQLEIGRDEAGRAPSPGLLLVRESSISFRHCILTLTPEGHCFVRDVSRNGTRVDGRRLVPNVETELKLGQVLEVGTGVRFRLDGAARSDGEAALLSSRGRTEVASTLSLATVLVGDIRDYTVLVRKAPSAELQQSVSRVFERLTAAVGSCGGTVKEFPGDAILAFWEGTFRGRMAVAACRAALQLDRLVHQIAADPAVWSLKDFRLRMDWALATGEVSIDAFGGDTTMGLSMVGEPVVLACRIEKFATDQTGPILACPNTRTMVERALREEAPGAGELFDFTDLGEMQAKGFDKPDHVFAVRARHA